MYPSDGLTKVTVKVLLKDGSSKQGNAPRASVGWNFEVAIDLRGKNPNYILFAF